MTENKAILLLEDGTKFEGLSLGISGTCSGELCFNTGMAGYQEIFTDPSYHGQILIMTAVHIGNYGVHLEEIESDKAQISGLVIKQESKHFSRTDAEASLQTYLEQNNVVGISGIDTRALVRHIRDKGAMNAVISSEISDENELKSLLNSCPSMDGLALASKVSTKEAYTFGNSNAKNRVSVIDLGVKRNILRNLAERDVYMKVFPYDASLEELLEFNPNGIFISNGPGDPAPLEKVIETVKKVIQKEIPLFGICLGHQIIALACGISTYKMFNGHRGVNHPIINLQTGKSEITTQNHGFAIDKVEFEQNSDLEITHLHLNDQTIAGLRIKNKPVFSVQYHPEAFPGPHDSSYLFDEFVESMTLNPIKL